MRSSDQIFTYFNASAVSRSTKPEIFMSLPLYVLSQSGPPKSVGGGGGGRGEGRILTGVKLDEKSIENGLEGQKFLVVYTFLGWLPPP